MTTIKDLEKQIQIIQDKADSQSRLAQQERDKADAARGNDDLNQMQAHSTAAQQYDQKSLEFQNQINDLRLKIQQMQVQANTLTQKRTTVTQTRDQELDRLDREIEQITGDPQ